MIPPPQMSLVYQQFKFNRLSCSLPGRWSLVPTAVSGTLGSRARPLAPEPLSFFASALGAATVPGGWHRTRMPTRHRGTTYPVSVQKPQFTG